MSATTASLELSAGRFTVLEGGLATIAQVLRFQSNRVQELVADQAGQ